MMLAVPTRSVLLRRGRSVLDSTVKASGLVDAGLAADTHRVFDRMADHVVWPDQLPNQVYLVEMMLPVAAFYRTLRDRGWDQPDAIRTVHRAFLATGDTQRQFFVLLLRSRLASRLFMRTLRPNWLGLTPPPANQWTVSRPTSTSVDVEVSRCYRLDAFRQLGTPEIAFIACYFEGYVVDVSPYVRLSWTAMATGADRCRQHFELLDKTTKRDVDSERYLEQPATG